MAVNDFDQNEELPIVGPIAFAPDEDEATRDDEEFSTLEDVLKKFTASMRELYGFNAFKLLDNATTEEKKEALLFDIAVNQKAYEKIEPLFSQVKSAVDSVIEKRKGGK